MKLKVVKTCTSDTVPHVFVNRDGQCTHSIHISDDLSKFSEYHIAIKLFSESGEMFAHFGTHGNAKKDLGGGCFEYILLAGSEPNPIESFLDQEVTMELIKY